MKQPSPNNTEQSSIEPTSNHAPDLQAGPQIEDESTSAEDTAGETPTDGTDFGSITAGGDAPIHAGDIMSQHIVAVTMDDTLESIRSVFERFKFRHVPVKDEGKLVGIISDRDVLSHVSPFVGKFSERSQDSNSLRRRAHQIMTRSPMIAQIDTPIIELGMLMLENRISCIPIVDAGGACVGMVTARDLLRWCLKSGCGIPHQDPQDNPQEDLPENLNDTKDAA